MVDGCCSSSFLARLSGRGLGGFLLDERLDRRGVRQGAQQPALRSPRRILGRCSLQQHSQLGVRPRGLDRVRGGVMVLQQRARVERRDLPAVVDDQKPRRGGPRLAQRLQPVRDPSRGD